MSVLGLGPQVNKFEVLCLYGRGGGVPCLVSRGGGTHIPIHHG